MDKTELKKLIIDFLVFFVAAFLAISLSLTLHDQPRMPRHLPPPPEMNQPQPAQPMQQQEPPMQQRAGAPQEHGMEMPMQGGPEHNKMPRPH